MGQFNYQIDPKTGNVTVSDMYDFNKLNQKLMRDRVPARDAVKHISKHVDHKPLNDEIEAIAKDRPDTDVRNVIKHHLRKAGMKNTHLL